MARRPTAKPTPVSAPGRLATSVPRSTPTWSEEDALTKSGADLLGLASRYQYRFDPQPVAKGGQGTIWFATRDDGLEVAIKVARSTANAEQALHHEIGMLRSMERHGIARTVRCLDVIDHDGSPGMVMPRYRGHLGTWLQETIHKPGENTLDDVLSTVAAVSHVLGQVHKVPWGGSMLVHRDVKPENLFITHEGEVHLGDFGGAMAITGLKAVELALFGSPMCAPLDQMLPGIAIPDPTWDTYALCVILYAAITGSRPAYQADPREVLTHQGRQLWELARRAIHAQGKDAQQLRVAFAQGRIGTSAADLIDVTGRGALNEHDRALLDQRLAMLCRLAKVPEANVRHLQSGLWRVLTRGLSPLSHPSPPNRYRDSDELAEQLEDIRDLLVRSREARDSQREALLKRLDGATDDPVPVRRGMNPWPLVVLAGSVLIAAAILYNSRFPLLELVFPPDPQADIPTRAVRIASRQPVAPDDAEELIGAEALVDHDVFWFDGQTAAHLEFETPVATDLVQVQVLPTRRRSALWVGPRRTLRAGLHEEEWSGATIDGERAPEGLYRFRVDTSQLGSRRSPVTTLVRGVVASVPEGRQEPTIVLEHDIEVPLSKLVERRWEVAVPRFRIDRHEVTWGEWAGCVAAGGCPPLDGAGADALPAVGLTFEQLATYCAWNGGRVASEAEWRSAAGPGRYPWGEDRPDCHYAHAKGCADGPIPVGSLVDGDTPEGVSDLAGNAWEWVRGGLGDDPPVLLGGSADTSGTELGKEARRDPAKEAVPRLAGGRCTYPPSPESG